jgi:hypothetical protein
VYCDFEWTKYAGVQANPSYTDLQSALSAFKNLASRDAGIYSAKGYTDQYLSRDTKWNNYKWWIANYGVTTPAMPYGVSAWEFWQFTDYLDGESLGINTKEGDGNYYHGTIEQFRAEYGLTEPQPPTQEDDMTPEQFNALISKMDEILAAIKAAPDVTPPPTNTVPSRVVTLRATVNKLVPTYDMPDVNSTKCLVYQTNTPKEGVPPAGHKGMPKEADLLQREIHLQNLFKEWAWIPKQVLKKASGTLYAFPDAGLQGQDIDQYPGMWVERKSLVTVTSQAWIDSLVAYLKAQW